MPLFTRKNFSTFVLVAFMLVILFVPGAKSFLLKGLLSTGLFNASAKRESVQEPGIVSFSFVDKNGNRITSTDLKGKIIFINFWAVWCPPCVAEMGSVNALYQQLKNDPRFVFVLADADGNLPQSTAFMAQHGYDLPVYQVTGPVSPSLYSGTLPTTLIIDPEGKLVQKHEGIANYNTPAMLSFLKSL